MPAFSLPVPKSLAGGNHRPPPSKPRCSDRHDMFPGKPKSLLLALALGVGLLSAAQAQSSSGNIVGAAVAGETIVVRGDDTGFHREVEIREDGKFTIRRIPTGTYTVVRVRADGTAGTAQTVVVQIGSTARVQ
ncbi:carboxypeptidase regulatory-like domain-containing protein [Luteimonas weifangensis]|uniref:Carboxypeptidase regulatory-like domain-containing protein n=2 Tax=Cognatiluteimonas weifangensis TaxID=2303539 RepID=A0A372DLM1_9GAMM|nr:carboxypeptidase regulatory-like domain-containing protein [Luteimonas weifangensis]